jgi:hypothetical protein
LQAHFPTHAIASKNLFSLSAMHSEISSPPGDLEKPIETQIDDEGSTERQYPGTFSRAVIIGGVTLAILLVALVRY